MTNIKKIIKLALGIYLLPCTLNAMHQKPGDTGTLSYHYGGSQQPPNPWMQYTSKFLAYVASLAYSNLPPEEKQRLFVQAIIYVGLFGVSYTMGYCYPQKELLAKTLVIFTTLIALMNINTHFNTPAQQPAHAPYPPPSWNTHHHAYGGALPGYGAPHGFTPVQHHPAPPPRDGDRQLSFEELKMRYIIQFMIVNPPEPWKGFPPLTINWGYQKSPSQQPATPAPSASEDTACPNCGTHTQEITPAHVHAATTATTQHSP